MADTFMTVPILSSLNGSYEYNRITLRALVATTKGGSVLENQYMCITSRINS